MTRRLSKEQQQHTLREMLELARFLTTKGVSLPEIKKAVGQLKEDFVEAYRQGIAVVSVDRESYLEQCTGDNSKGK